MYVCHAGHDIITACLPVCLSTLPMVDSENCFIFIFYFQPSKIKLFITTQRRSVPVCHDEQQAVWCHHRPSSGACYLQDGAVPMRCDGTEYNGSSDRFVQMRNERRLPVHVDAMTTSHSVHPNKSLPPLWQRCCGGSSSFRERGLRFHSDGIPGIRNIR